MPIQKIKEILGKGRLRLFSLRYVKERASSDEDPQGKNRETHKTKLEKEGVFGVWQVLCWWEQHPLK